MGYTSVSSRRHFLEVSDSSCFDTILFTEVICVMMAFMTSPILMVLPSLLVSTIVFCPEFVTDRVMGVLTGRCCATGAGLTSVIAGVGDSAVTGGATGLATDILGCSWKCTSEVLCRLDSGVDVGPLAKVTLSHRRLSSITEKSSSTPEQASSSDEELSKKTLY